MGIDGRYVRACELITRMGCPKEDRPLTLDGLINVLRQFARDCLGVRRSTKERHGGIFGDGAEWMMWSMGRMKKAPEGAPNQIREFADRYPNGVDYESLSARIQQRRHGVSHRRRLIIADMTDDRPPRHLLSTHPARSVTQITSGGDSS